MMVERRRIWIYGAVRHPATFGGQGFLPRLTSHDEEVRRGLYWTRCGARSEWGKLEAVLLTAPTGREVFKGDPDAQLLLGLPDAARLREQFRQTVAFFESQGTRVYLLRGPLARRPNLLFVRDLFVMTQDGAVLARPASEQRAGEERYIQASLADIGVPIRLSMRGHAHLEGADVLRIGDRKALIGLGRRTNREGAEYIAEHFAKYGVYAIFVDLPRSVQHLLGVVNFVDADLAAVDAGRAPPCLVRVLRDEGVRVLALPSTSELRDRRALNFVALGPRRVVMSSGCPRTKTLMEQEKIEVFELNVSEYIMAGGGLGCATGILLRS